MGRVSISCPLKYSGNIGTELGQYVARWINCWMPKYAPCYRGPFALLSHGKLNKKSPLFSFPTHTKPTCELFCDQHNKRKEKKKIYMQRKQTLLFFVTLFYCFKHVLVYVCVYYNKSNRKKATSNRMTYLSWRFVTR